ncbi:type II secretion system secretin GspD [Thalassotalea nanhaiensis]|uniref:Type II secretion system secretin GspD n=1 Tax=Thalassotalea nanhaiensis TaxID=3065648 RepID=A0ABY9TH58_9GAMM|nr:type II secretion system secretin GspD [Colwelliaceae bacterium SQ345]
MFTYLSNILQCVKFNNSFLLFTAFLFYSFSTQAEETFHPNFNGTEINEFIDIVGKNLQKSMIIDPKVEGLVNVRSYQRLNKKQYFQFFQNVLNVYGYAAVAEGDVIKVLPNSDAKKTNVRISDKNSPGKGDEIVHRIVKVKNITVRELSPLLRQLNDQSGNGNVVSYDPANVVVLTGSASSVQQLTKLIENIDKFGATGTEIIQLAHASASELVVIIETTLMSQNKKANNALLNTKIVADNRSNAIVVSGPEQNRVAIIKLINQLDKKLQLAGNTRIYYLKYANAEELVEILQGVSNSSTQTTSDKPAKANINIDAHPDTNALIITAKQSLFPALETVIRKLDIRRAQVLVEAIIVEILETDGMDLGVQWYGENGLVQFNNAQVPIGSIIHGKNNDQDEASTTSDDDDLAQMLSGAKGAIVGIGNDDWGALLQAVAVNTNSNILATPSITTVDNEEASFLVGQEIPIITGSAAGDNNSNPFQTVERQEVGIKLTVTPQINEGTAVQLIIAQEVSSVSGTSGVDVSLNKRTINTTVLAEDGDTIVLGGLIDEDVQEVEQKVPFLGDIPYLGRLFSSTSTTVRKRNLMVFIKPTILRLASDADYMSQLKYHSIRNKSLERRDKGLSLMPVENIPVLPKIEESE